MDLSVKNIIGKVTATFCIMACSSSAFAQADLWVWKGYEHFKLENADSVTFVDPQVPHFIDGYEYVDLGLNVKWATCNVGASKPFQHGDFFAWGETSTKDIYSWTNYTWCDGTILYMTKYCLNASIGAADMKTVLDAEDDVALSSWGKSWRMPTSQEQEELLVGCTWEWTDDYKGSGVAGQIGTSKINGNTIFFPATGCYEDKTLKVPSSGLYWSSDLLSKPLYGYMAVFLSITKNGLSIHSLNRNKGVCVRPVVNHFSPENIGR